MCDITVFEAKEAGTEVASFASFQGWWGLQVTCLGFVEEGGRVKEKGGPI
jgi:hypothetical protein